MRFTFLILVVSLLGFIVSTLTSCTSGKAPPSALLAPVADLETTPVGHPFGGSLPPPSELLAGMAGPPRAASYVPRDLYKLGEEYDPALPYNEVNALGDDLYFDSWLPPEECTLADVAYAGFHFEVPGFDRSARVLLAWTDVPLQPEYWYIALANWDTDRWDFYTGNADNDISMPEMEPYLSFGGDLAIIVFCTGPLDGILDEIRIGGPEPIAHLEASPTHGTVPLVVHLDAGDSLPIEGTITTYEWDVDGDGEFEVNTGLSSSINPTITENGEYRLGVKVTNTSGSYDTDTVIIEAVGDWTHTWGFEEEDMLYDVLQTSDGSIFATGFIRNTTGSLDRNVLLLRVSATGIVVWAKSWDTGLSEWGRQIVQLDGGDLVVAGTVNRLDSNDLLVQRWTRSGQLVWSRRYGGSIFDNGTALVPFGNDVFVAGDTGSTAGSTADVFIVRLDPNGVHYWDYARDFDGGTDRVTGMCPLLDENDQTQGVIIVGDSFDSIGETTRSWKWEIFYDGILRSTRRLNSDAGYEVSIQSIVQVPAATPAGERLYSVADLDDGSGIHAGLLCHNGLGSAIYTKRWTMASDCRVRDVVFFDASSLAICGWLDQGSHPGALWNVAASGGSVNDFHKWNCSPYYMECLGVCPSVYDGVMLAGAARNAEGVWQSDTGAATDLEWDWVSTSLMQPIALEWSWDNEIGGTVDEIRDELRKSADDGKGDDDLMLAHRML